METKPETCEKTLELKRKAKVQTDSRNLN